MEILLNCLIGLFTCALGVWGSALIKEENRISIQYGARICCIVSLALILIVYGVLIQKNAEEQRRKSSMFLSACREYFEKEDYTNAINTIITYGVDDAQSCMIYAYFLANGYGISQNIPLSIEFYTAAKMMGEERAESNLVISVIKNCSSREKIDIIRTAYQSGNEVALKYVDYVVKSLKASAEANSADIDANNIWNLDEKSLIAALNKPFFRWICSNKTYTTSVSTTSTPTFTRRFLYQIGTQRVYEECILNKNCDFPDWLQEDIW